MRYILSVAIFFVAVSISAAVSLEEVVKLTRLKTSDEVIVDLIVKTGVDKPLTVEDVVYLKEQNVSDRVITQLLKASNSRKGKSARLQKLPDNMRMYYTTNKEGKQVRVVTNIDEKGKRIGGELPPEQRVQPPPQPAYPEPEQPREIRVIVQQEPLVRQEPDVIYDGSDRYGPPRPSDIPLYGGYDSFYPPVYPGGGGYPLYPFLPNGPCFDCKGFSPKQPSWHVDAGYGRGRKPMRGKHIDASRPGSKGTRRSPK